MLLSDLGAEVIEIAREGAPPPQAFRGDARGRKRICLNLKSPDAVETCLKLIEKADIVFEGNRPGVMERLGLGPELLIGDNPRLVYGRMTGWGQEGPLAQAPGHDINYIAVSGVLHGIGHAGERPAAPVNYVGDFGGGGMMLAFGMVSALLAVRMGAPGQVVDVAMTDGSALLAAMSWGFKAAGAWSDAPGTNFLSGAAPFYRTYTCADGRFVALGASGTKLMATLVHGLRKRGLRYGLQTMCEGGGIANVTIVEAL
jgi:alpha-methylacyl-CoA racemase